MLIRFIVWLIVGYIIAKILGVMIYSIRKFFSSGEPKKTVYSSSKSKQVYRDVQDIDYEEIEDTKKQ